MINIKRGFCLERFNDYQTKIGNKSIVKQTIQLNVCIALTIKLNTATKFLMYTFRKDKYTKKI